MSDLNAVTLSEKEAAARLQELHENERRLSDSLIRMKAEHGSASKDLASLQETSREKFGTDDIGELRQMYRKGLETNTESILAYEAGLQDIEKLLNAATEQLSQVDSQG